MTSLYQHSIDVILRSQAPTGAYVASPNFPSYAYAWLRDGSFIAHAMDRAGEHESAGAFFRWAGRTVVRHATKVERALARLQAGEPLGAGDYLPTRYTTDGTEATEQWWDFQLDGYGTWLWAAAEYVRRAGDQALVVELAESVRLVARYLTTLWRLPGYDLWEEHADYLHPYTLAAVYAGLRAAAAFGAEVPPAVPQEIHDLVLTKGVLSDGGQPYLVKSFVLDSVPQSMLAAASPSFHDSAEVNAITSAVDASLIGVATPFRLVAHGHPLMQSTLALIEAELHRPRGGVYRYRGDSYYGGGEWVLLAAWLGWHYAEAGAPGRARELLRWVEAQADGNGNLPEQVSGHLLAPERYAEWEQRWGPVASPLVWSHAMYLLLYHALREGGQARHDG